MSARRGYREQEHSCRGGRTRTAMTWWEFDRHGIEICRVCDDCKDEKLARFNPDYEAEEPIDGENYPCA